eukprot:GHUV01043020.1.p1 GENE.GHUV01043020.1~~GHUV01043020.1.p1  ORF type:complete len:120 (+),score=6.58 GHUV01043020.1:156-515(+)
MLYKEAMKGVRKHLVRHIYDGTDEMSFVSEATADIHFGTVSAANDRFEHLTCFAGGMFVLGKYSWCIAARLAYIFWPAYGGLRYKQLIRVFAMSPHTHCLVQVRLFMQPKPPTKWMTQL